MSRSILWGLAALALSAPLAQAAVSVTVVDYTPGTQSAAGLDTVAYKDTTASKIQDMSRDTGSFGGSIYPISLSNGNFAASTIIPIGRGGGISLKFETPIYEVAGKKEFGIFVGNLLLSTGGLLYGDMRGSILVSQDNSNWRTLDGQDVAANDLSAISSLNAPSAGYQYASGSQSSTYGLGTTAGALAALALADYETEMPDDSLFNGAGATNAGRASLYNSTDGTYGTHFGTSAGGNWFDISAVGWQSIQYLRINVTGDAAASIRLDAVFANAAAVPEPTALAVLGFGALHLLRRRKRIALPAIAACSIAAGSAGVADAATFDDIAFWTGTGDNRAAMVVEWRSPEVFNNTSLPAPITSQTLAWGYRFDGVKTGEDMFNAIVAADPRLYALASGTTQYGKAIFGLGYDLDNDGQYGLTDGVTTYTPASFTNGLLAGGYSDPDTLLATDDGDLYWGGWYGPNWELWHELGANGGFESQPDRGSDPYFTSDGFYGGVHGEWEYAQTGISGMNLSDGSWMGWSIAAGGLDFGDPENEGTIAWMEHKVAPGLVPEPATSGMVILGAIGFLARRTRNIDSKGAL